MGFDIGDFVTDVGRGALALGTGGASELVIAGANAIPKARGGGPEDDMGEKPLDPKFEWGGKTGQADADFNRYQALGPAHMTAPLIDYSGSAGYMGQGDLSRNQQVNALDLQRQAALGLAPSRAEILMRQGNDQAMSGQASMAAGARGPAAMALAQQQAMGNASAMQTSNQANMGALRAQEMADARGAYMGGASSMRGQDLSYAQQMAQQSQAQAQMGYNYRNMGLENQRAYEQMAWATRNAQLQAQMGQAGYNQDAWKHQNELNQTSRRESDANAWKAIGTGVDLAKGAFSGGFV